MACASRQRMMPTLTETSDQNVMPYRSRAEAARLLEEFREVYQSLAPEGRSLIRMRLAKMARVQFNAQNQLEK